MILTRIAAKWTLADAASSASIPNMSFIADDVRLLDRLSPSAKDDFRDGVLRFAHRCSDVDARLSRPILGPSPLSSRPRSMVIPILFPEVIRMASSDVFFGCLRWWIFALPTCLHVAKALPSEFLGFLGTHGTLKKSW